MTTFNSSKKLTFFIILSFQLLSVCYSQSNQLDSLKNQLELENTDSTRVEILIDLSFQSVYADAQEALKYAQEATVLAKKIGHQKGIAQGTRNQGLSYRYLGKYDSAILLANQAYELAKEYKILNSQADALNTLATTYMNMTDYTKAVQAIEESIEIFTQLGNIQGIASSYGNLGIIHKEKGLYVEAIDFYTQALFIYDSLEHHNGQANIHHNMATIYQEQNKYELALQHYKKTSFYDGLTGNIVGHAYTLLNVGNVLKDLGKYQEAIENYHAAINLATKGNSTCMTSLPMTQIADIYTKFEQQDSALHYLEASLKVALPCQNSHNISSTYHDFGKFYQKNGDYLKAIENLKLGLNYAQKDSLKPKLEVIYWALYETYKAKGDNKNALKYLELSSKLNKELFNEENEKGIAQLEANFKFEKERALLKERTDKEKYFLEEKINKRELNLYYMLSILSLLLIISFILYRAYRRRRQSSIDLSQANIKLENKNDQLKRLNEELVYLRKKEEKDQKRKNRLLNLNLLEKEKKLTAISMMSHEKNISLKSILKNLEELEGGDTGDALAELRKEIKAQIRDSNSWDDFIDQFEKLHPGFIDTLNSSFTDLTDNDIKLCTYLKVGMDNKQIATATNIAVSSVKKKINRLKKKMELLPEDDLRKFLIDLKH